MGYSHASGSKHGGHLCHRLPKTASWPTSIQGGLADDLPKTILAGLVLLAGVGKLVPKSLMLLHLGDETGVEVLILTHGDDDKVVGGGGDSQG